MKKKATEIKSNTKGKKKKIIVFSIILIVAVALSLAMVFFWLQNGKTERDVPLLIVETPQRVSLSQDREFVLDVTISDFGEALYPAASISVLFDSSHLDFLAVEEGNVFVCNYGGQTEQKLPSWSCNIERCNESGNINVMYLDMTGGKNAFRRELLAEDDNVVLRLRFRLRGSARVGDVYDLIVDDAVFAASDESQSLAKTRRTLRVKNAKVVVGE